MIVTVTLNPCIDLNLEVEEFSFTQPLRALCEKRRPGGKGINVSAVLKILGTASTAIVPLGGPSGQEFLSLAYHVAPPCNLFRAGSGTNENASSSPFLYPQAKTSGLEETDVLGSEGAHALGLEEADVLGLEEADVLGLEEADRIKPRCDRREFGVPAATISPESPKGATEDPNSEAAPTGVSYNLLPVPVEGNTRTNIVITARSNGQHLKVNQRGSEIRADELAAIHQVLSDLLSADDVLVLAGSLPPGAPADIYARWITEFRSRGCFVALDADQEAFREGLKAHPHLIKPNREELERLAAHKLDSEEDLLRFARGLIPDQCDICLLSNGAKPAYLLTNNLCLKGWPPEAHGSPVGAGDACLAGMIFGLNQKLGLQDAFRTALACGSAAASTPDTEYFPLDLFHSCRNNVRIEALAASK